MVSCHKDREKVEVEACRRKSETQAVRKCLQHEEGGTMVRHFTEGASTMSIDPHLS